MLFILLYYLRDQTTTSNLAKVIQIIARKIEHRAQRTGDALIGGLSHKLKPGASYVTNRRSVSYFASGGNTYSPNGVKVMKFNLTGDQWLDPSTFRVAFQLNDNNGNNADGFQIMVQPLG